MQPGAGFQLAAGPAAATCPAVAATAQRPVANLLAHGPRRRARRLSRSGVGRSSTRADRREPARSGGGRDDRQRRGVKVVSRSCSLRDRSRWRRGPRRADRTARPSAETVNTSGYNALIIPQFGEVETNRRGIRRCRSSTRPPRPASQVLRRSPASQRRVVIARGQEGLRRPRPSPRRWTRSRPRSPTPPAAVGVAMAAQPVQRRAGPARRRRSGPDRDRPAARGRCRRPGSPRRVVLVAEPERDPTAVGPLLPRRGTRSPRCDGRRRSAAGRASLATRAGPGGRGPSGRRRCGRTASVPQPRQNVGQPPSAFCKSSSQPTPGRGRRARFALPAVVDRTRLCRSIASASRAPAVSSASGTAPLRSVQPQPPGAAWVNGWTCAMLARQQPVEQQPERRPTSPLAAGQGVDRQRRVPRGQVRVDRPGAVVADRVDAGTPRRGGPPDGRRGRCRPGSSPRSSSAASPPESRRWPAASARARRDSARRPAGGPAARAGCAAGGGSSGPGRWPPARAWRS